VLILGCGDIVHNLRRFDFHNPAPVDWAVAFNERVKNLIESRQHEKLIDYQWLGTDAHLAIPTREHYLPLLYVLALQSTDESHRFITDSVNSSISMTSVIIGA
jgi:4,5-DOPA dioxygenase extradiol